MTRGTSRRLAACLATGLLAVTGCSGVSSEPRPEAEVESQTGEPQGPVLATEREVARLLARRAGAMAEDRRTDFRSTSAPGPERRRQLMWFDALGELPVASAAYDVSVIGELTGTDRTRVAAQLLVRLEGFDSAPVAANHVLELERDSQGWRVVRDRQSSSQVIEAPWQLPEARVRATDDVILVADRDSEPQAERLLRLTQRARATTRAAVRYPWRQGVVVLAPSTDDILREEGLEPVEIARLGGIASQVVDGDGDYVTSRVVLLPGLLDAPDAVMLTLLRHELVHVAVGQRADGIPLWINEGIAEWAARRGDANFGIPTPVVRQAARGITEMPIGARFLDESSATAYGVAWFAMEWLAQEFGEQAPYNLLDAAGRLRGEDERAFSQLLERRYGLTADQLARRAGELIVDTFR